MKNLVGFLRNALMVLCAALLVPHPVVAQGASWRLDFNENDIFPYRPVSLSRDCRSGNILELSGHKLPAERGGTGVEDPLSEDGHVIFNDGSLGDKVAFSNLIPQDNPTLSQLYRDYYITMRWNYVKWGWDGFETVTGDEDVEFYSQGNADGSPRKIMVTNPNTGQSIIAVILEAGPAPWTGVLVPPNSLLSAPAGESSEQRSARITELRAWLNERAPDYWNTPQAGTPEDYNGRVSGLPPTAIAALGAKMRMADGNGDDLIYSWAPDQRADPGPVGGTTAGGVTGGSSLCSGRTIVIDGLTYAFPLEPQTKMNYGDLPCSNTAGCHWSPPIAAFDLLYGADRTLDGKAVYAIADGVLHMYTVPYKSPGATEAHPECRSLHLETDEIYGGHHYWYGHLKNVIDEDEVRSGAGRPVRAGDKIAEIADYDFGQVCRGGRDHLHIDRGIPPHDGGGRWRDPAFVDFFNRMWEALPEN